MGVGDRIGRKNKNQRVLTTQEAMKILFQMDKILITFGIKNPKNMVIIRLFCYR